MTTPGKDDDTPEFSDSDQQWFDRLSGKLVVAKDEAALREADALRLALATERAAAATDPEIAAANAPDEQERRWQELQFRLKREGLLEQTAPSRRRFWQASVAVAATVVMAVVLFPRIGDDGPFYDEPPTMRGDFTLVKRQDAKPRQAADALATGLQAGGLQPRQYQLGNTFTVDVELLPDAGEAALAAFKQAGLAAKAGITRVEISPK
ncbi:MAG: hypothetical protein AD742_10380 [Methylibium sp. NZG]|nr:MAG: hypothetical protein AD742_10380 [Methylibium sp. NZG]